MKKEIFDTLTCINTDISIIFEGRNSLYTSIPQKGSKL